MLRSCPAMARAASSMRPMSTRCSGWSEMRERSPRKSCSACSGCRRSWLAAAKSVTLPPPDAPRQCAGCRVPRRFADAFLQVFLAGLQLTGQLRLPAQLAADHHGRRNQRRQRDAGEQQDSSRVLVPARVSTSFGVALTTRRSG